MVVLNQLQLKSILRSADYTGRITKWVTILGAFDIKYMPRTSVKGQVLVDLVAEFTEILVEEMADKQNMDGKSVGDLHARTFVPEGLRRQCSESQGIWCGASHSISREDHD